MTTGPSTAGFRALLRSGALLAGPFVKSPSYPVVEVVGRAGPDFMVLDAEHAPFGTAALDACCLAARATGVPALVRTPGSDPAALLRVLDMGAAGVLVPHVDSAGQAEAVVAACRYRAPDGERGFSNSPRAGDYGDVPMAAHMVVQDASIAVVAQIETAAAVDQVQRIASVEGVDALFIGRADLAASYRLTDLDHPDVAAAVARVCRTGRAAGKVVGMFLPDATDIARHVEAGVTMFVIGSDQSLLKQALRATVRQVREAVDTAAAA